MRVATRSRLLCDYRKKRTHLFRDICLLTVRVFDFFCSFNDFFGGSLGYFTKNAVQFPSFTLRRNRRPAIILFMNPESWTYKIALLKCLENTMKQRRINQGFLRHILYSRRPPTLSQKTRSYGTSNPIRTIRDRTYQKHRVFVIRITI